MIDNYEIKQIDGEDRLFLYFNLNYEFGGFKKNKNKSIKENIKDYLIKNKINYQGTIISIVVGGVLIGNLVLNKPIVNNEVNYYKPSIIDVDKLLYVPNIEINENESKVLINEEIKEGVKDENIVEKQVTNNSNTIVNKKNKSNSTNNSTNTNTSQSVNSGQNTSSNTNSNTNTNENTNNTNPSVIQNTEPIEEKVIDTNTYVKVKRKSGEVETIELEEYIIGVVGAEMPALFHKEALKSQAVIARTYALKSLSNGKILTDTESTQSYKDKQQLQNQWGNNYNTYYNKIKECVDSTKGMYLTYNGKYIEAVYHSTSNGKTESSSEVWGNYYPYLVSVESPYDNLNPSFSYDVYFTYQELSSKLGLSISNETEFNIIGLTEGNRVKNIEIYGQNFEGTKFRNLLGLRSTDFTIEKNETGVKITTKGYGHGVGLSQYGANGMAKNGSSFKDILKHYYRGVSISVK